MISQRAKARKRDLSIECSYVFDTVYKVLMK